jgi:hypothetical protein
MIADASMVVRNADQVAIACPAQPGGGEGSIVLPWVTSRVGTAELTAP